MFSAVDFTNGGSSTLRYYVEDYWRIANDLANQDSAVAQDMIFDAIEDSARGLGFRSMTIDRTGTVVSALRMLFLACYSIQSCDESRLFLDELEAIKNNLLNHYQEV